MAQNASVTITYPNGKALEAIVLLRDEHEIRAHVPGCNDVLAFNRVAGTWVSEDGEPVIIGFQWQRRNAPRTYSEADFACPKELAAHLIRALLRGDNHDETVENAFVVFSPQGTRVAVQLSELQLN